MIMIKKMVMIRVSILFLIYIRLISSFHFSLKTVLPLRFIASDISSFTVTDSYTMRSIVTDCSVRSRGSIAIAMMSDSLPEASTTPQLGRVTMYSKVTCPFCIKSKELLEEKYKLIVQYVDIEEADSTKREDILQQLRTFSGGRNTVPQIFFNSEHIGGNDDLYALEEAGLLAPKVASIRTTPVSMMMDHWYHPWY